MKSNFSNIQKLFLMAIIILVNASIVFSEGLNFNNTETKVKINSLNTSFNLFTGCNSALNILGGTPYYDNDCKTDISIWRPGTTGQFWIWNSSQNNSIVHSFGTTGDMPLGGDYDGDGITDLAVYRTSTNEGYWHIIKSSNSAVSEIHFGTPNYDLPVPSDYDGDGKTDVAVFRLEKNQAGITSPIFFYRNANTGIYEINSLAPRVFESVIFPVADDYDGDGKADIAIWRDTDGLWEMKWSSDNTIRYQYWGNPGDIPTPGNYPNNGVTDGKADIAYFRPSTGDWHIINSNGGSQAIHFGSLGDKPVPGDYDGDGIWDLAIQRDVGGNYQFHILGSSVGYYVSPFGLTGDIPITFVQKELPTGPILRCPTLVCSDECPRGCR